MSTATVTAVERPKKASRRTVLVRKIMREVLGAAFWVHALYISHWLPLPIIAPSSSVLLCIFNLCLLAFIANYTLFSNWGWFSVVFDVAYVYFLPFIYVLRILWWALKALVKFVKQTNVQRPAFISPKPVIDQTTAIAKPTPAVQPVPKVNTRSSGQRFRRMISDFAILWSIFVFTIDYSPFLIAAVIMTLLGALGAFRTMWELFSGEPAWFLKVEEATRNAINLTLEKVEKWDGSTNTEEVKNYINALRLYESIFNFIQDNRQLLLRCAFAASVAISLPFYLYISYLFAVVYFGIGKITHLVYPFSDCLLHSMYIPFAWTDLPKSFAIRLLGGLHAIIVTAMGYTIFLRHLGVRFEKIVAATERLGKPLRGEGYRQKTVQVQVVLEGTASAAPQPSTPTKDHQQQSMN